MFAAAHYWPGLTLAIWAVVSATAITIAVIRSKRSKGR